MRERLLTTGSLIETQRRRAHRWLHLAQVIYFVIAIIILVMAMIPIFS
jgi:predicted nucleic acid-binding Zn ribbon protein